jgi:two-component sensor histidine kinase
MSGSRHRGHEVNAVGPRVSLPDPIAAVFITDELHRRASPDADYLREKLALQDLASQMADHPAEVLPRLVKLAMEICDAESAGISILEPESEQFRWFALSGVLSTFEGATTPRNFSPCGVCIDNDEPVLMDRPERAYDWIRDANIIVPEVLLVPLRVKEASAIGTLWIVADDAQHFHKGHARIMTELAAFAGMALRMIQTEERLQRALQQQELLTKEMSHRVKNLFAITDSMIRMSARNAETKDEFATSLSGRLHALAAANSLVRRTFAANAREGVNFGELIQRILQPHEHAASSIKGPELALGEQATNNLALVFHEMATNASKYGALSNETGSVAVDWAADATHVQFLWREAGGPVTTPPSTTGFGTKLVATTIERIGGAIDYDWQPQGLTARLKLPLHALKG